MLEAGIILALLSILSCCKSKRDDYIYVSPDGGEYVLCLVFAEV